MTGVLKIIDENTNTETYRIFCQDCGFEYETFISNHYCPVVRSLITA